KKCRRIRRAESLRCLQKYTSRSRQIIRTGKSLSKPRSTVPCTKASHRKSIGQRSFSGKGRQDRIALRAVRQILFSSKQVRSPNVGRMRPNCFERFLDTEQQP